MLSAKIKTEQMDGTIAGLTFANGLWKDGGVDGQGKLLFLRDGRVCFDIGWVGCACGNIRVNDDEQHTVGVRFTKLKGKYEVLVDGEVDAISEFGAVADHPDLQLVNGI